MRPNSHRHLLSLNISTMEAHEPKVLSPITINTWGANAQHNGLTGSDQNNNNNNNNNNNI